MPGKEHSYHWRLGVGAKMALYQQAYHNNPGLPVTSPIYFLVTVPQFTSPLSGHIHTIDYSLFKEICKLRGFTASGLHFLFEDSRGHIKTLLKFVCLFVWGLFVFACFWFCLLIGFVLASFSGPATEPRRRQKKMFPRLHHPPRVLIVL